MTTKPKAKKFRIRRSAGGNVSAAAAEPLSGQVSGAGAGPAKTHARGPSPATARRAPGHAATAEAMPFAPDDDEDDGFGEAPFPSAVAAPSGNSEAASEEAELAKIRQEGLTGRQLRMARRVAQKHGVAATSDFDAVRLLRKQGIDPFERSNMLQLVRPDAEAAPAAGRELSVPQTAKPQLPSTEVLTEDARAREIVRMQRDIVRRRHRKMLQLAARLAFFVLLPTFIAGWYYFRIATPMYSTHSEFVIQQAQNPAASAGGLGGMFSGTSFATSQDSIAVQGYLQSIDAMLRLDADLGFREHFSAPEVDPLQRLDADASKEEAYDVYRSNVKISYDPTEGIIKMDVVAADPETSRLFSERLIGYAEEQVDNLSLRLREDQMQGARESFEDAEAAMIEAQRRVLALQERLGVLDPMTESQALMSQITGLETQLADKRLQLQQLLDNPRPNEARVDGARGDVRRLEALIAELRAQLTESNAEGNSLARTTGELRLAERDLQTRELMMTQALQQLESARIEANRQTRYLSMSVTPIAPDTASYPRAFENTLLAFLIFGGIYLMISLTASVLREQISS
jgi:capsular polysaccharide transport system permease protein